MKRFWILAGLTLMTLPLIAAKPVKILALGDSLTEGYGLSTESAYPAQLEQLIAARGRSGVTITNAGVSGSTSASAVSRLKWHLKAKPDILILALGANDALRGLDPADTRKNLAAAIELAQKQKVKVLLVGMKAPPNYGNAYSRQFETIFTDLAKQYRVGLAPFLLEGVAGVPKLNLPDGLHPNALGYQRIAAYLFPYIWKLLPA